MRSPRNYRRRQRGESCCCSVQHMGEHAIARRVYALPAGGCTGSLVIHRRNVHPAAPAAAPTPADALTAPLISPWPSSPWSAIRSVQLYARPNLVPDEALVAFPQIRCSRCLGGVVCGGGSHCGATCGEASGRLQAALSCKTDRPSVENDRLADTFLINTSSVQYGSWFLLLSFYASSTTKRVRT